MRSNFAICFSDRVDFKHPALTRVLNPSGNTTSTPITGFGGMFMDLTCASRSRKHVYPVHHGILEDLGSPFHVSTEG